MGRVTIPMLRADKSTPESLYSCQWSKRTKKTNMFCQIQKSRETKKQSSPATTKIEKNKEINKIGFTKQNVMAKVITEGGLYSALDDVEQTDYIKKIQHSIKQTEMHSSIKDISLLNLNTSLKLDVLAPQTSTTIELESIPIQRGVSKLGDILLLDRKPVRMDQQNIYY